MNTVSLLKTFLAAKAYGHQFPLLFINKSGWLMRTDGFTILGDGRETVINSGPVQMARLCREIVNSFITVKCHMVTVHSTPVSFVRLVIHLGAAPPLQLLFLKAIMAFTSSTDKMS